MRGPTVRRALGGALAGAVGVTALNTVTYLDMTVRGRPPSELPERAVEETAQRLHTGIPGRADLRRNRTSALGALSGIAVGIGIGTAAGLLRGWRWPAGAGTAGIGGAAMAVTDAGMARLAITDPRTWSAADWTADVVPHLAFGAATWGTLRALGGGRATAPARGLVAGRRHRATAPFRGLVAADMAASREARPRARRRSDMVIRAVCTGGRPGVRSRRRGMLARATRRR